MLEQRDYPLRIMTICAKRHGYLSNGCEDNVWTKVWDRASEQHRHPLGRVTLTFMTVNFLTRFNSFE